MLKKLSLSLKQLNEIYNYCKLQKIKFALSVFDHLSLKNIIKFNLDFIKIPSGEITNFPLLKGVAKMNKKIILSTGMCNNSEIKNALKVLKKYNLSRKKLFYYIAQAVILPARMRRIYLQLHNLKKFKLEVGYSDHTIGNEAANISVAYGARIFEKHFTISKKMSGPDHAASLNPKELKDYINSLRKSIKIIGSGMKMISKSEKKIYKLLENLFMQQKQLQKEIFSLKKTFCLKDHSIKTIQWIGTNLMEKKLEEIIK